PNVAATVGQFAKQAVRVTLRQSSRSAPPDRAVHRVRLFLSPFTEAEPNRHPFFSSSIQNCRCNRRPPRDLCPAPRTSVSAPLLCLRRSQAQLLSLSPFAKQIARLFHEQPRRRRSRRIARVRLRCRATPVRA
ncbi:hypothetical protein Csa_017026, partial [Cucumis sativus]